MENRFHSQDLWNKCQAGSQILEAYGSRVDSVYGDAAPGRLYQPVQRHHEGGLAASCAARNTHLWNAQAILCVSINKADQMFKPAIFSNGKRAGLDQLHVMTLICLEGGLEADSCPLRKGSKGPTLWNPVVPEQALSWHVDSTPKSCSDAVQASHELSNALACRSDSRRRAAANVGAPLLLVPILPMLCRIYGMVMFKMFWKCIIQRKKL